LFFHCGNGEEDKEKIAREPQKEVFILKILSQKGTGGTETKKAFYSKFLVPTLTYQIFNINLLVLLVMIGSLLPCGVDIQDEEL